MIAKMISGGLVALAVVSPVAANTLEEVRERGVLNCGVHEGAHGFSNLEERGWVGMDVDFCRAIAAAVLGEGAEVEFSPTSSEARFEALKSGAIDVLVRTTTATLSRDSENPVNFAPAIFYTGTAIMTRKAFGVQTIADFAGPTGPTICLAPGSTTELNVASAFEAAGVDFTPIVIKERKDQIAAYLEERCDVLSTDHAALVGILAEEAPNPEDHVILDELLSKEPLSPVTRDDDPAWSDIVKWTFFAMLWAEEVGITSGNIEGQESKDPRVAELLGDGDLGPKLGLSKTWAQDIITNVGNYGEVYDAHFGPDAPVSLPRGLNALYKNGGLHYPWPFK